MANDLSLRGKVIFITGSSRGIGKSIALRAAKAGAHIAIVAKTVTPHPKLEGTIHSVAKEIESLGGKALALQCDIRNDEEVAKAIKATVDFFGGIDVVINNASAISLTGTEETSMKKYDLMNGVNSRGTFLVTKLALPYLKKSAQLGRNPHILMLGPPLDLDPKWFSGNVAYTIAKFGMSMCVLGFSEEFREEGIAANSLWPQTGIETAAISNYLAPDHMNTTRKPEIMADAAFVILSQDAREYTGNFTIDEGILRSQGIQNLDHYRVDPRVKEEDLMPDFFVPDNYSFTTPPKMVLKARL
ncbi:hypothetical protein DFS34DRAFT_607381 [Phlyctochytrium arcticum]|nr:hypothetical protein DFS34DRAFT_607381 [Phlyctochytrium arcticum]